MFISISHQAVKLTPRLRFLLSWKINVYEILRNDGILENRVFGMKKILEKALFYPGISWKILELDSRARLATLKVVMTILK